MNKKVLLNSLRKFMLLALGLMMTAQFANAQEDNKAAMAGLKAKKAGFVEQIEALKAEIVTVEKAMEELPGWSFGSFGTVGVNFSQFSNWLGRGNDPKFVLSFIY